MRRKLHRKQRLSTVSEINLTPLIDLAFSLLIIFMVTTPFLEQTIALNLPVENHQHQDKPSESKFQIISIDAFEDLFWGKTRVDIDELDKLLSELSRENDPAVLDIRAERSIPYQRVVDVLGLIKKHNLTKISLDTQAG